MGATDESNHSINSDSNVQKSTLTAPSYSVQIPIIPGTQPPQAGQYAIYYGSQPNQPTPNFVPYQLHDMTPGALQQEEQQFNQESRGCKRSWGCKRSGNCCKPTDDGRPLGTQTDFVLHNLLGTFLPAVSLLLSFGFETSKLSRVGVLFGNANFFFAAAAGIVALARHHHDACLLKVGLPITLIVGTIFLIVASKSWKRFRFIYEQRQNKKESELVNGISLPGVCRDFLIAFVVSILFSLVGAIVVLIAKRHSLRSRHGAFVGLAVHLVGGGIFSAVKGSPPILLVVGMFFIQLCAVHFRRAIVCAEMRQNQAQNVQP